MERGFFSSDSQVERSGFDLVDLKKDTLKRECRFSFAVSEKDKRAEKNKVALKWRIETSTIFSPQSKQQLQDVLGEEIENGEIIVESDLSGFSRDMNIEAAFEKFRTLLKSIFKMSKVKSGQIFGSRISGKDSSRLADKKNRTLTKRRRMDRNWQTDLSN